MALSLTHLLHRQPWPRLFGNKMPVLPHFRSQLKNCLGPLPIIQHRQKITSRLSHVRRRIVRTQRQNKTAQHTKRGKKETRNFHTRKKMVEVAATLRNEQLPKPPVVRHPTPEFSHPTPPTKNQPAPTTGKLTSTQNSPPLRPVDPLSSTPRPRFHTHL